MEDDKYLAHSADEHPKVILNYYVTLCYYIILITFFSICILA